MERYSNVPASKIAISEEMYRKQLKKYYAEPTRSIRVKFFDEPTRNRWYSFLKANELIYLDRMLDDKKASIEKDGRTYLDISAPESMVQIILDYIKKNGRPDDIVRVE